MSLLGSDFNPSTPRDTDPVADGAAEIRDLKSRLKDFVSVKFDPETGQFKSASSNITLASSDPSNPNLGDVYFNTVSLTAFVFTTSGWVPILRSALPFAQQLFSASGSFTVPVGVYRLKIHAWGAGGGGSDSNGVESGSGGGGGAYGCILSPVTPGQVIPFTIGTGGTGGVTGSDGGDTTIVSATAGGGKGSTLVTVSGLGGTASGFDINFSGGAGLGNVTAGLTNSDGAGGDAGGWGGKGGMQTIGATTAGRTGTSPGGGGSGGAQAASLLAGSGANGGIVIEY